MTRLIIKSIIVGVAFWASVLAFPGAAPSLAGDAPTDRNSSPRILVLLRMTPPHFRPNSAYSDSYGDGADLNARRRMAARLARKYGLTVDINWPMSLLGVDCFVMETPADRSPEMVALQLSRDPNVEWSEPMAIFQAKRDFTPHNDPLFAAQPAAREWRLEELHKIATGRNIRVAIIDSKIDESHPDLVGQIYTSQDFSPGRPAAPEDHGTGVAGVIAALANNREGIVGVAPNARLMALRACWQKDAPPAAPAPTTICDTLSLAKALDYAITHGAQIINLSLSGPPSRLLAKLIDTALARDVTVVAAYDNDLADGGFPASHVGVVAVSDGSLAVSKAGVYEAPGRDIPTTEPGKRWFLVNGGSFAAAHVSGLFALVREHCSPARTSSALISAEPGYGPVNAQATLLRAAGPCDCACSRHTEYAADIGE
ncbi:MAG: S8 family serine peptidase [Amphiplicatus sp.]